MSTKIEPAVSIRDDGVRHYTYLCFMSLLVMALCLSLRGFDTWSLLPTLVGALVLVFRWRTGPLMVLVLLAWLMGAQRWAILNPIFMAQEIVIVSERLMGEAGRRWMRPTTLTMARPFLLADLALCASTIVYTAGHYRVQGLVRQVFPGDPRRRLAARGRVPALVVPMRRSPGLVSARELVALVATVPVWIGLAWLCWRWLSRKESPINLDDNVWQAMLLAWLLGLLFIVASGLLGYLAQLRIRPEEAAMFLQDTLWQETRREQRREQRWWVWARRRQRRKEGK
jgi:hypothetical protein